MERELMVDLVNAVERIAAALSDVLPGTGTGDEVREDPSSRKGVQAPSSVPGQASDDSAGAEPGAMPAIQAPYSGSFDVKPFDDGKTDTAYQCPDCQGQGYHVFTHYVTRDMATDAGEPSMEGQPMDEKVQCDQCGGTGVQFRRTGPVPPTTTALTEPSFVESTPEPDPVQRFITDHEGNPVTVKRGSSVDATDEPCCNLPPLGSHALTTPQRPDWTCGCCGRVWRHNTSLGGGYWQEIQGPRPSDSAGDTAEKLRLANRELIAWRSRIYDGTVDEAVEAFLTLEEERDAYKAVLERIAKGGYTGATWMAQEALKTVADGTTAEPKDGLSRLFSRMSGKDVTVTVDDPQEPTE